MRAGGFVWGMVAEPSALSSSRRGLGPKIRLDQLARPVLVGEDRLGGCFYYFLLLDWDNFLGGLGAIFFLPVFFSPRFGLVLGSDRCG